MKSDKNKLRLSLAKIKITKLDNMQVVVGGATVPSSIPVSKTCTTSLSTKTAPIGSDE